MSETVKKHKIKRVLIANRGEIAVRIIRCLSQMGLESVAIYADSDRESLHAKMADFSVAIGGMQSNESYLLSEKIIKAAKDTGADAVHPGYGFLSENADFAEAVQAAGLVFIGPNPESIRKLGDKIAARDLAANVNVPTTAGSKNELKTKKDLEDVVSKIGLPVILKAAAGGGGRGMRIVRDMSECESALEACRREALSYFANDAVFCEKFIENPRHIEVQVIADQHGNYVHLFERDCSIQRRHQKLIEEAPSKFLNEEQRENLGKRACAIAKAANYHGAGTVEFICESPEEIFFMEMNTRIQVEHPVTEEITGVDLIREQVSVAMGNPLSFKQDDIEIQGWSIECRINAENPHQDFQPSLGTIKNMHLPSGKGVRVDTHLYEGYTIPEQFDSMIAKVICHDRTRDACIQKCKAALKELYLGNRPTSVTLIQKVMDHPDFISGDFTTKFLEKNLESLLEHSSTVNDVVKGSVEAAFKQASAPSPIPRSEVSNWSKVSRQEALQ